MLVLDLAGVRDRRAFMDRCVADLHLPDWFGRTWDALADCLTDLSWWPAEPGGRQLRVRDWQGYAAQMPREWRIVKDVLRDAELFWRHTDTELVVVLEDGQLTPDPEIPGALP
ncbi:barstar family protein [Streptomyces polygonati]|uniref:Barstar family protein n=1 Tax=Streptomyces polygonati TaxID=1617087 RepID=A0ABV8HJ12_9ACTN